MPIYTEKDAALALIAILVVFGGYCIYKFVEHIKQSEDLND